MSALDINLETATPIERIRYLMARLREPEVGCPWDAKQTFATIAPFTIEEAYEVADAIARGDLDHLQEELGDLLFQVIFYCQMAEEKDRFDLNAVAQTLERKLVRRHPHVFPDGTLASRLESPQQAQEAQIKTNWDAIKLQEKAEKNQLPESILDAVPAGMSPVRKAQKLQSVAAKKGFDWEDPLKVMDKLQEELAELQDEVQSDAPLDKIADELGDLMFCCVNLARHFKLDAEMVMTRVNHKFERRFRALETALQQQGISLDDASLEQMEAQWQAAKRQEKQQDD